MSQAEATSSKHSVWIDVSSSASAVESSMGKYLAHSISPGWTRPMTLHIRGEALTRFPLLFLSSTGNATAPMYLVVEDAEKLFQSLVIRQ
jgi:hypothetical protein